MTQNVLFWGRLQALPIDPQNSKVQRAFTSGQCHSLARALHRLTGWQLIVLGRLNKGEEGVSVRWTGDHVVCQMPDGRYVDIFGAWPPGQHWKHCKLAIPVQESTVRRLGWDSQNVRAAHPFALKVLEGVTAC